MLNSDTMAFNYLDSKSFQFLVHKNKSNFQKINKNNYNPLSKGFQELTKNRTSLSCTEIPSLCLPFHNP